MRRFDEERRTYEGSDEWYRDRDRDRGERDRDRGGFWSGDRDEDRWQDRERRGRGPQEGYGGPYGGSGFPGYGRDHGREQSSISREGYGGRDWGDRDRDRDRERESWGGREQGGRGSGDRQVYREERYAPDRDFQRGGGDEDEYRGRGGYGYGGRDFEGGRDRRGRDEGRSWSGDRDFGQGREFGGYGGGRGRDFGEDDYRSSSGTWGGRQGRTQEREGWRGSERGPHAGRGPRSFKRSDDQITNDVNERLEDDDWLDASDIEVHSEGGIVTLEGKVTSKEAKRRAEDIAGSCKGVKDVMNRLRVEEEEGILERIGNALPD
jgi:hypothetical protein